MIKSKNKQEDSNYWKIFYKTFNTLYPTNFAIFVRHFFLEMKKQNNVSTKEEEGKIKIVDCGCGNGRDSYFFGLSPIFLVHGIDKAFKPIDSDNCTFRMADMVLYDKSMYDVIYCRFTLHSLSDKQQLDFLKSITTPNTFLCIETRSIKDKHHQHFYGNDHFRNYTDILVLKKMLYEYDFDILYCEESKDFAQYMNENPVCIRIISIKR